MMVSRNIVVCCDGTANEFEKNRTNVVKLFRALAKDPVSQVCYYHPGIGTMAAPGFVTKIGVKLAEIAGLAFGYGLNNDICDAYTFISRNFESGDKLYLFGFSRGAYTVRAIASLLHMYGLLWKDNDRLTLYAVRMMWAIRRLQGKSASDPDRRLRVIEYFQQAAEFKATFSRECKPHFVGVWDTVSSVGWFSHPLSLPYTASNPDIAIGRHAVALDERRAFFRTNLWRPDPSADKAGPKNLKQVWFPGVHCDVGGGYAESESGLSKVALKWMIDEGRQAGLKLDEEAMALVLGARGQGWAVPDPDAKMHDSLTRGWRVVEYIPKPHWDGHKSAWRANRFRRRRIPGESWVHDAAWIREKGAYQETLPTSAVRLSLMDSVAESDRRTGTLNILVEDEDLQTYIGAAGIARVQRLLHGPGGGYEWDDIGTGGEREFVVPAGRAAPKSVRVAPGRYRIQVILPAGRILQTERTVIADESLDVRLRDPSSVPAWLGWQRFFGVQPDASALRERVPRLRGPRASHAVGLSAVMRELLPALRHPGRLDWIGAQYLAGRLARLVVKPLSELLQRWSAPRLRAKLYRGVWPWNDPHLWDRLSQLATADAYPPQYEELPPVARKAPSSSGP